MIREKTKMEADDSTAAVTVEWVDTFHRRLEEKSRNDMDVFFHVLPMHLLSSELVPYLTQHIEKNSPSGKDIRHEVLDKCLLLGEYRRTKKRMDMSADDMRCLITEHVDALFEKAVSYDDIQQAMLNMEHRLLILSPEEDLLFDSKTWGEGLEGVDYQDVLMVMAHPDGSYDSVGRMSHTKDNNQKITRIFHYDDPVVEAL